MKTIYTNVAGGLVLALVLSDPAFAARGEPSYYAPPGFGDLDIDRNGSLDRGEVQGRSPLYGEWESYDTNRDGLIESSEFAVFDVQEEPVDQAPAPLIKPARGAAAAQTGATDADRSFHPSFAQLDIDGNGVLSKAEAAGAKDLLDYWDQGDIEANNVIERSEFAAFEARGPMPYSAMPESRN